MTEAERFLGNLLRLETPEDAAAICDLLPEGWERLSWRAA